MKIYLEVSLVFAALGIYVFSLFRWWYRYLVGLAERFDIPNRRKRAELVFPVVLLLFIIPALVATCFGFQASKSIGHLAPVVLLCSLAPGLILWKRTFTHWVMGRRSNLLKTSLKQRILNIYLF